jgi:hypothetical protein
MALVNALPTFGYTLHYDTIINDQVPMRTLEYQLHSNRPVLVADQLPPCWSGNIGVSHKSLWLIDGTFKSWLALYQGQDRSNLQRSHPREAIGMEVE